LGCRARETGNREYFKDINIVEFGAKPDGHTDNTVTIQNAIDQCSSAGGGVVSFPPGTYMSGSIFVKSNVTIHLHKFAILHGIASDEAYPKETYLRKAFIHIYEAFNVSITGEGTIDGNG